MLRPAHPSSTRRRGRSGGDLQQKPQFWDEEDEGDLAQRQDCSTAPVLNLTLPPLKPLPLPPRGSSSGKDQLQCGRPASSSKSSSRRRKLTLTGASVAKPRTRSRGKLCLDISLIEEEHMKRETEAKNDSGSFNVPIMTDSGKLRLDEFELGCAGIASRPGWGQWPKNDHVSASSANLQDDFVRIGVLGKGSSGVVYKALHIPTLTLVAQKVIPACDHHSLQKLSYELRALHSSLSQLGHQPRSDACPNIVAMHDAFVNPAEDSISIIFEYMDGGSLQDIVDTGGCSNEQVLASISCQILGGLVALHSQQQIHRDVKPASLLINHKGRVKISSFGTARSLEDSMSRAATFVGTLAYMSPERLAGEEYDYSADIWGLGLCIVACALGRTPVGIAPDASCDAADEEVAPCDGSSSGYWNILQRIRKQQLPQLPAEFSLELRDFVRLCLDKEPTARPSAEELLQHPFVKGCSCSPTDQGGDCENDDGDDFADEQTSGNGSEHAFMEELHEILNALQAYVKRRGDKCATTLPTADQIRSLAGQLGIPSSLVQRSFAEIFDSK